jgi:transposase
LLALTVTPANDQERAQVAALAEEVQAVTGHTVALAWVDQGDTGEEPAEAAEAHGIELAVVKLPEAKKGFDLLPRRWVVERSFAWAGRFRRLAKDDERLPETVRGLHFLAFAGLMLHRAAGALATRWVQRRALNRFHQVTLCDECRVRLGVGSRPTEVPEVTSTKPTASPWRSRRTTASRDGPPGSSAASDRNDERSWR